MNGPPPPRPLFITPEMRNLRSLEKNHPHSFSPDGGRSADVTMIFRKKEEKGKTMPPSADRPNFFSLFPSAALLLGVSLPQGRIFWTILGGSSLAWLEATIIMAVWFLNRSEETMMTSHRRRYHTGEKESLFFLEKNRSRVRVM